MGSKYNIRLSDNNTVEITKPNSSIVVYKFRYEQLLSKTIDTPISNRFVVYILIGKNSLGQKTIYVGKSKNGLDNRPTAHEADGIMWEFCYILTTFSERTFFNDGVIQYIENRVNKIITEDGTYHNITKVTNVETITLGDTEDCEDYLKEALMMLYVLGLSFNNAQTVSQDAESPTKPMEVEDVYNNFLNALTKE